MQGLLLLLRGSGGGGDAGQPTYAQEYVCNVGFHGGNDIHLVKEKNYHAAMGIVEDFLLGRSSLGIFPCLDADDK